MTENTVEDYMENKYIVLKIDCNLLSVEVLGTFDEYRDALTYLTSDIQTNEEYNDVDWYKTQLDHDSISVYKCGYIFRKSLMYRYFIKHY